jgi:hypothetical protein
MADFTVQREFTTREPVLPVTGNLTVGLHTFQLVAVDQSGNKSRPAQISVEIVRGTILETPVIRGGTVVTPVIRGGTVIDRVVIP